MTTSVVEFLEWMIWLFEETESVEAYRATTLTAPCNCLVKKKKTNTRYVCCDCSLLVVTKGNVGRWLQATVEDTLEPV